MNLIYKANKGFTLAEILITVTIIGIVASFAIPTLYHNIQEESYKTRWISIYSILNQATISILMDQGGSLVGVFKTSNNDIREEYLKYLSYVQKCNSGASLGSCWHASHKNLNGGDAWIDTNFSRAILTNGMLIAFLNYDAQCDKVDWRTINGPLCGEFYVDVNGWKKPNIRGKDIFGGWILLNGLKPHGYNDGWDPNTDCTPGGYGIGCSAKFLMR
ncbi:MAG: hypothetical protein A2104_07260 [Candidatus Melainabacteria bacterium GWF2_32_7]|nr:MAG: hypothetical protein A2104_07260 [Candidatus Melainabacteria bacterium GWF2_32_7]